LQPQEVLHWLTSIQIFGGLLAYGIARGTDAYGSSIAPWKIIFLSTGLLTVSVGVVFLFIMPDNQLNARFLNEQDRILALERIRRNQQGVGNHQWKIYQLKEALTDPLSWAFFLYALISSIPNGGLTNFFSLLIVSLGYSAEQSLLYATPGGAIEVVTLIACGYLGDRYGRRLLVSSFSLALAVLGIILVIAVPASHPQGRLVGYYFTQASPAPFVAILSLVSSNVAGYTKKTTVAAMYLIGYCAGNIIGTSTISIVITLAKGGFLS
jgi:MFS transporter, ACS family, allantoate permease